MYAAMIMGAIALVGLFPALAFWGLDAYYLRCERLFRVLYDETRLASAQEGESFCLSTDKYKTQVSSWSKTLFSPSIIGLHGVVVLALISAILTVHFTD